MKFKNTSPLGDLDVPALGVIVPSGEEFDVPDELAEAFAGQPHMEPVDDRAHAAVVAAEEALAEVNAELNPEPLGSLGNVGEPAFVEPDDRPAGNAPGEQWAEWLVRTGRATAEEVSGLGRMALRAQFEDREPGSAVADQAGDDPTDNGGDPA